MMTLEERQERWDRMSAAKDVGTSLADIGAAEGGLSAERVRQVIAQGRPTREAYRPTTHGRFAAASRRTVLEERLRHWRAKRDEVVARGGDPKGSERRVAQLERELGA